MSGNDLGTLNSRGSQNITSAIKHSQVYDATHWGDGNRLPFMNRSFISFTYGGRYIEDFNLIATITGDRMDRSGSAPFADTITTYENLDGQFYWATHYQANKMNLVLSTDGIDQKTLDDFLYWFRGGVTRELILSEHPNRAIQARVATTPGLKLLPFEQDVILRIADDTLNTKTTLFKGDITLSFIMDEPYWYSLKNILGKQKNNEYVAVWDDINGQEVEIYRSYDALKILYEDGIPLTSMFDTDMLVGNKMYVSAGIKDISRIWDEGTSVGARIESADAVAPFLMGIISGSTVTMDAGGISTLASGEYAYLYYAGTAPSPTEITFTLTPLMNDNGYIVLPKNISTNQSTPYNKIVIESLHKQELRFTTPNIFTSYNKTIEIFRNKINNLYTWEEVRAAVREEVRHPTVRAYAVTVVEGLKSQTIDSSLISTAVNNMKLMFCNDNSSGMFDAIFTFNSKTGSASGTFQYRATSTATFKTVTEDVGDMIKSNYIYLQDRNYPKDGKITGWKSRNDETKQYSHRIYHDVSSGLKSLEIVFKNMYL